jgi:hypothetical protein
MPVLPGRTQTLTTWLQHLQNRVPHATGNFDRFITLRELQVAFNIPNVYDYITKLCEIQAEVILNHVNPNVRVCEIGKG